MLHKIALSLIPGIGNVLARTLIAYVGSVEGIFEEKKQNLIKIPGIGEVLAQSIANADVFDKAEQELLFIEKNNINTSFYLDKEFPARLKTMHDAPMILYWKGSAIDLDSKKIISIVGTRKMTNYGRTHCERLIDELKEHKHEVIIVSGLAYGVDICAHKAALKNNLPTIGIVAHGLDTLYPSEHKKTASQMLENGAIMTEYTSKTALSPKQFVKRNRIIAGISAATIVIESASEGGSLLTAQMAADYGRDVFAFPGRIGDKYSEGCNLLIKAKKSSLIENVTDLETFLRWEKKEIALQQKLFTQLTPEEQILADILKQGNLFIDEICSQSQMPSHKVLSLLLNMEFAGCVKSLPGKIFQLV